MGNRPHEIGTTRNIWWVQLTPNFSPSPSPALPLPLLHVSTGKLIKTHLLVPKSLPIVRYLVLYEKSVAAR